MPGTQNRRRAPRVESLEARLELSALVPANSIGSAPGAVLQPGGVSSATVTVAAGSLTTGKASTFFGIFVGPVTGSTLEPRIAGVLTGDGHRLSIKQGRPFAAGRADGQAAAFVKVSEPGPLTVLVRGEHGSTGQFSLDVTLTGDANGDGVVNQADLAPFASAYLTTTGNPNYNAAADFNRDGIVNQVDAKALEGNMPPVKSGSLKLVMNLLPADQAQYPTPKNSGGATFKRNVTIVGHTLPGSIVIQDGSDGFYKWVGPAYATDSKGVFTAPETLTQGINTFDFLIIDPRGRQLIRSYPIYWLPFAASGSKLK
jgi:Dockerin type I domain